MDCIKADNESMNHWGVVYSYGSVLTVFDNEQDARTEAIGFGGAVVRLACNLWNTLNTTAEVSPDPDSAV